MLYHPNDRPPPPTTTHFTDWSNRMALDFSQATACITITALSMQPPKRKMHGGYASVFAALTAAPKRGVALRVILPAPTLTHPATLLNAKAADWLRQIGARCDFAAPPALLHAKTATIDDLVAWIGSGNFTAAAANYNREAYIRTRDAGIAQAVRDFQNGIPIHAPGR